MDKLLKAILVACDVTNTKMDDESVKFIHTKLVKYGDDAIKAIEKATEHVEYKLTLASIMKHLPKTGEHPDAELAWAHVPKTETDTAYVTSAMLGAMDAAQPLYDQGDEVAARMAFKAAYSELIKTTEPDFFFSGGYGMDYETKQQTKTAAIEKARQYGWLTEEKATRLLTSIGSPGTSTGLPVLSVASTSEPTKTPQKVSECLSETAMKALEKSKKLLNG